MEPYRVEAEPRVVKRLRRIGRSDQRRILDRVKTLATDPRPAGCIKLKGPDDTYRVRQGNYRIVYTIDDRDHVITVTRVDDRRDVYR